MRLAVHFTSGATIKSQHNEWPIVLYSKSVLKQRKFREITELLGSTEGLECLDVGGDNGVISYLLRRRGGMWKSADLDGTAVRAIRELVGDSVFQIDGGKTCFKDDEFDRVVIVDFLEHIHTDAEFTEELFRILKPNGELIINVPYVKKTLLRKLRHVIGETDEKHGHVRPGYTPDGLSHLLHGRFKIVFWKTYSKFFSEFIDTFLTLAVSWTKKGELVSSKGLIVTGRDLSGHRKIFRLYSFVYPFLWLMAKLDMLLFWTSGYMLIIKAKVEKSAPRQSRALPQNFKSAVQIP